MLISQLHSDFSSCWEHEWCRPWRPTCRRSKRYWKCVFWFLFDTAITWSFILLKESPNRQRKSTESAQFPESSDCCSYWQTLSKTALPSHDRGSVTIPKARRIKQCSLSKLREQPMYGCSICDVNLCVICFEPFHSSRSQPDEEWLFFQRFFLEPYTSNGYFRTPYFPRPFLGPQIWSKAIFLIKNKISLFHSY